MSAAMLDMLKEVREYFRDRMDINDETNDDGSPRPNKEMQMFADIDEVITNQTGRSYEQDDCS